MRLTKQSGYAVRIVSHCAIEPGELTRIAEIAELYSITKHNIAKTVPILVRNGILEGVRGRNGGIRLARPASEITVGEIVRACETTRIKAHGLRDGDVLPPSAKFDQMLDAALEAFISILDQHSVQEMIKDNYAYDGLTSGNGDGETPPLKMPKTGTLRNNRRQV